MPRKTYKKRTYKKRTYKRRRYYKRRYYKRRYYKRNNIKKPEIHILDDNLTWGYNNLGNGVFKNITFISGTPEPVAAGDGDLMKYYINNKPIEGRKIRLKYLYINTL